MSTSPNLIGTAEASRLLGVSRSTVLRLVESGDLKVAHVVRGGPSGIILYDRFDVEDLAKQKAGR